MNKTAIILETQDGIIKDANNGMIALAAKGSEEISLFLVNPENYEIRTQKGKRPEEAFAGFGISKIVNITPQWESAAAVESYRWAEALIESVRHYGITTLFGISSSTGKEILPRVAAALDAPLIMDCIDIDDAHENVKTYLYSGKTLATVKASGNIKIFGIRPNLNVSGQAVKERAPSTPVSVESYTPEVKKSLPMKLVDRKPGDTFGNNLLAADIIISGGRAMKNSENFRILEDCAAAMGPNAAVGASRVAVDFGWVPYRMQVGQTGEKVSPKVYIACGISGSVQHFAGMKTSGIIIAINESPSAAIMSNCDYFVEADLFDIVPALTEALKRESHG